MTQYKKAYLKPDETRLGMPWGKATAKLNRMILFNLIQATGRDICHRCNTKITTPEDVSRDHIVDWRQGNASSYWDLSNIAFSHKRCNVRTGGKK